MKESSLKENTKPSAKGILSKYANPELQKEEGSAWERAIDEKYGIICKMLDEAIDDMENGRAQTIEEAWEEIDFPYFSIKSCSTKCAFPVSISAIIFFKCFILLSE